jgi:EmrB/QacA subfamily drug resistance transporter
MRLKFSLPRQALIPMIVACGLFMENLDSTVIATALPAIAQSLAEDPLQLNLAITSYLLSLAVFLPLSGWLADRFGARTVFCSAVVVFTLGSIGCGLSQSLAELVAARILQGLGGAMMVPVGRLVILRTVPKSELVSAMAYLSIPALIGPVFGPPLGGFIVTYGHWRWIFFINVPIGLLGLILAARFIENTRETPRRLDALGFIYVGVGLAGLMFGFESLGRGLLPTEAVVTLLALGAVSIALYVIHARRTPHRILDLTLFHLRVFRVAITGGLLFRVGVGALPFLLPLMLQLGFGLSAFASGLLTFASAAGALTMKITAGPIIRRFGFRRVLIANAVISSLFIFFIAFFTPSTPHVLILAVLLIGGFFRSLEFTSLQTVVYADVSPAQMSQATTLSSMVQQLATTLGVGIGALFLHLTVVSSGGGELTAGHFAPAFVGVAALSMLSAFIFRLLPERAGDEISGRAIAAAATPDVGTAPPPPPPPPPLETRKR